MATAHAAQTRPAKGTPASRKKAPAKPVRRTRIEWTPTEKARIVAAGVEILANDPGMHIKSAFVAAMKAGIEPDRQRNLHSVTPAHYRWFAEGVKVASARPVKAQPSAPPPAPPSEMPPIVGVFRNVIVAILDEIDKHYMVTGPR